MTTLADVRQHTAEPAFPRITASPWTVAGFAVLAAAMRVPYLRTPMSSDEGGFLYLAKYWSDGGGSLYGRYWVDRPPLLIALFRLADATGGLVALRVLGCVAVAVAVLGLGLAAGRVLGSRAATWAAATACATLTAPLLGATNVNGELLATPFVAVGLLALVSALTTASSTRRLALAVAAGGCAAAAVLVKQNVADVAVSGVVLLLVLRRRHRPARAATAAVAVGAGLGATVTGLLVLGAAAMRGTSPWGVLYAMYPFRVRAAGLMGHLPLTSRVAHLERLVTAWVISGAPLLVVGVVVLLAWRRLPQRPLVVPFTVAVLALTAFDAVSVAAGGSYWSHYLVQLSPAAALSAGLLAGTRSGLAVVALVVALCGASWAVGMPHTVDAPGQTVGEAIGDVSAPGDTVVSLLGNPDIVEASGLTSPYRYLWSLPSRTLDPRMTLLDATLTGADAPTWVVVRGARTFTEVESAAAGPVLADRYQWVADVCGRSVYLRDGVTRTAPESTDCRAPLSSWFDHTTTADPTP